MTRGFAAIGEPNVAVCLLPGTEVAFEEEVKYERLFALFARMRSGMLGKKVAQFRRINIGKPNVHHDALEFPDGETVLLTRKPLRYFPRLLWYPVGRSFSVCHPISKV